MKRWLIEQDRDAARLELGDEVEKDADLLGRQRRGRLVHEQQSRAGTGAPARPRPAGARRRTACDGPRCGSMREPEVRHDALGLGGPSRVRSSRPNGPDPRAAAHGPGRCWRRRRGRRTARGPGRSSRCPLRRASSGLPNAPARRRRRMLPVRRRVHPGQDLHQGRLAGPVVADEADRLGRVDGRSMPLRARRTGPKVLETAGSSRSEHRPCADRGRGARVRGRRWRSSSCRGRCARRWTSCGTGLPARTSQRQGHRVVRVLLGEEGHAAEEVVLPRRSPSLVAAMPMSSQPWPTATPRADSG